MVVGFGFMMFMDDGNPLVAHWVGQASTIRDYAKDCQWQEEWEFRNVIV